MERQLLLASIIRNYPIVGVPCCRSHGEYTFDDMNWNAVVLEVTSSLLCSGNELKSDTVLNYLRRPVILATRRFVKIAHRTLL